MSYDLNFNTVHLILSSVKRLYRQLPELVGQGTWDKIHQDVDTYIAQMESQPENHFVASQIWDLLSQYELVQERLYYEITVQKAVSANIDSSVRQIAESLGFDARSVEGLVAATCTCLSWEVDTNTVPTPKERTNRGITMVRGLSDRAKSIKFINMKINLRDFANLAAGFLTTGVGILDKPYPLVIVAGVLLTISTLYDTLTVEFSEQETSVFWGMIQAIGEMKGAELSEHVIFTSTNVEREKYGLDALKEAQVKQSLRKLMQLKVIENTDDRYHVIENYTVRD